MLVWFMQESQENVKWRANSLRKDSVLFQKMFKKIYIYLAKIIYIYICAAL